MKIDLFPSWATAEFSKFAGILNAVLSQHYLLGFETVQLEFHHLLALFIMLLPKAHLTSHSRMSSFKWMITPSWLAGSLRYFLYSSSVYSWCLFLLSSASVRSIPFLFYIVLIFAWNVPLVSLIFSKRSLVFPVLMFSSISLHDPWGRLSYLSLLFFRTLHWSGNIFPFLLCFSLLFFSQIFVRSPQTTTLPFCISFSWGWSWSMPAVQCVMNLHP